MLPKQPLRLLGFLMKSLAAMSLLILIHGCQEESLEFQPTGQMVKEEVMGPGGDNDINHAFYQELNELKAAVAPLKNLNNAIKAGWWLDATGYVPHMGHHYLNPPLMDGEFDHRNPELLLFIPGDNGKWVFVGVEYAVPIADMNNIPPPPEGFTGDVDTWVVNHEAELWTLHVWIDLENPDGMFAPFNPNVP